MQNIQTPRVKLVLQSFALQGALKTNEIKSILKECFNYSDIVFDDDYLQKLFQNFQPVG